MDRQKRVQVYYKGVAVGHYCADLTIEDIVICELKTNELLNDDDEFQLINYLKATRLEVGLLLNFGKKPALKRKIYDNN